MLSKLHVMLSRTLIEASKECQPIRERPAAVDHALLALRKILDSLELAMRHQHD